MLEKKQHIAVIGGGAWGTALAVVMAGNGKAVTLYARNEGLARKINTTHENDAYLPGIPLPAEIQATDDLAVAGKADIVLLVTPAQFLRALLPALKPYVRPEVPLVNCAKGIEVETGALLSQVVAAAMPGQPYAVLSGPTFAGEVARGLPTALTFATTAPHEQARGWAQTLSGPAFRPYLSADPAGAEICGALKNVIAIACGIVEGKKLGQNARSAVMTRGLAEMRRFGHGRGAQDATFMGLSGIGDLTLTCHSMSSRNFSLGVALGAGQTLPEIMAGRRSVAEGVATARAVAGIAAREGLEMPICLAVNDILHGGRGVDEVIHALLSRGIKDEDA